MNQISMSLETSREPGAGRLFRRELAEIPCTRCGGRTVKVEVMGMTGDNEIHRTICSSWHVRHWLPEIDQERQLLILKATPEAYELREVKITPESKPVDPEPMTCDRDNRLFSERLLLARLKERFESIVRLTNADDVNLVCMRRGDGPLTYVAQYQCHGEPARRSPVTSHDPFDSIDVLIGLIIKERDSAFTPSTEETIARLTSENAKLTATVATLRGTINYLEATRFRT